MLMLLCGGFGYCILDRVQTQKILKLTLEESAAQDLGGQSACQTVLEPCRKPCRRRRPSGSVRLAAERAAGHGAWPTCCRCHSPTRRHTAGELAGLCRALPRAFSIPCNGAAALTGCSLDPMSFSSRSSSFAFQRSQQFF